MQSCGGQVVYPKNYLKSVKRWAQRLRFISNMDIFDFTTVILNLINIELFFSFSTFNLTLIWYISPHLGAPANRCVARVIAPRAPFDVRHIFYAHCSLMKECGGALIADEVQVGFGRVGDHWWAFQQYGTGNVNPFAIMVQRNVIHAQCPQASRFLGTLSIYSSQRWTGKHSPSLYFELQTSSHSHQSYLQPISSLSSNGVGVGGWVV